MPYCGVCRTDTLLLSRVVRFLVSFAGVAIMFLSTFKFGCLACLPALLLMTFVILPALPLNSLGFLLVSLHNAPLFRRP